MTDLLQAARLFEVSSKLSDASAAMDRLARGQGPSGTDKDTFCWAGHLLEQVDWLSGAKAGSSPQGALAVDATATRPTFYASLVQIAPDFSEAGINQESEVYDFLREVYGLLVSGGSQQVLPAHVRLGARFLHVLSNGLLVQLSNNGLPKTPTTLTLMGVA
jgi:hypothetical protein